ncbi:MAG: DUF2470 domain-containing protein [Verrucomicrobiota bacterium]
MSNEKVIEESKASYDAIMDNFLSVQLGTANAEGVPEASYTPAIVDEDRVFYVYVSDMSAHTGNMLKQNLASVLVIEDEQASKQIFARHRATFDCQVSEIERDTERWTELCDQFIGKFGKMFEHLMAMGDFHMLALKPSKGRLVVGFGKAFDITGKKMDQLEHVKGNGGHGHRPVKGHGKATANGEAAFSEEAVQGMIEHMNDDHSDSVLLYAHHFSGKTKAQSAVLKGITAERMTIELDSGESVDIDFPHVLQDSHDAHMTMVKMSKEARQAVG